jgi:hypothetical protein
MPSASRRSLTSGAPRTQSSTLIRRPKLIHDRKMTSVGKVFLFEPGKIGPIRAERAARSPLPADRRNSRLRDPPISQNPRSRPGLLRDRLLYPFIVSCGTKWQLFGLVCAISQRRALLASRSQMISPARDILTIGIRGPSFWPWHKRESVPARMKGFFYIDESMVGATPPKIARPDLR